MSTQAQLAPDIETANSAPAPRGGPTTTEGKAISSKNAITNGLFAIHDFIRPGEEPIYTELDDSLDSDLTPSGMLECNLVDEIRRAMWRLRRCGQIEESLVAKCFDGTSAAGPIPDAMQNESTARLQNSVDRARALSHRLLHKCTAELRILQTERIYRNESFDAGTDISDFGVCDLRAIQRDLGHQVDSLRRRQERADKSELDALLGAPMPPLHAPRPATSSFCKEPSDAPSTPRNADCPCGSGLKHKRCCGKDAPPVLQAA